MDFEGWLVIHQIAVDHGLAVTVGIDRRAENRSDVQRGRGGQADLDGGEVIEHPPILGNVILKTAEGHFGLGHLAV